MEERIAVVDAQNRFVRWSPRSEIHVHRLVHRSVYVFVFDDAGRMLIQQRHADKQTFPLHWDLSCAGHVAADDYPGHPDHDLDTVYHDTAVRELEEELGIVAPIEELAHMSPIEGVHYEQIRLFRTSHTGAVSIQEEEVAAVQWLDRAAIEQLCSDPEAPVTRSLRFFSQWLVREGHWPT